MQALRNTKLLWTYCSLDQRVRVLGYALKQFAKVTCSKFKCTLYIVHFTLYMYMYIVCVHCMCTYVSVALSYIRVNILYIQHVHVYTCTCIHMYMYMYTHSCACTFTPVGLKIIKLETLSVHVNKGAGI